MYKTVKDGLITISLAFVLIWMLTGTKPTNTIDPKIRTNVVCHAITEDSFPFDCELVRNGQFVEYRRK
jgi:hypothetical protein